MFEGWNAGDKILLSVWILVVAAGLIWQAADYCGFKDIEGLYLLIWLPLGFYSLIRFDQYLKRNEKE